MHPSPDVLALLALGEQVGTPDERAHVSTCAQCQAEVADLARAVAAGREGRADTGLVSPPARVWDGIRAELGFGGAPALDGIARGAHGLPEVATRTAQPRRTRVETNGSAPDDADHGEPVAPVAPVRPLRPGAPEAPAAPTGPAATAARTPEPEPRTADVVDLGARRGRSSRGRRVLALAVAAALTLAVGIGLGAGLDSVLGRQKVLWTAELQALPQFPGSTGRASVLEDARGNRTLKVELDSPQPVDGSREVWLIDRGISRLKSIGYLTGDTGQWPIPGDLDPRRFPVVDVSKEPPDDTDLAHSKVSIVRGTLDA